MHTLTLAMSNVIRRGEAFEAFFDSLLTLGATARDLTCMRVGDAMDLRA